MIGKVVGIIYDHFGDFVGFILEDECAHEHRFESREKPMLDVVQRAWEERFLIRVIPECERTHIPRAVILIMGGR